MKRFVSLLAVVALLALFSGSASASHWRDRCHPSGCHRDRCSPPPSCHPRDRCCSPPWVMEIKEGCQPLRRIPFRDPCHTYPYRPCR